MTSPPPGSADLTGRVRQFFDTNHRAVMITMRRDGTPQSSPVLVVLDDDGRLIVSTRETAMKTRNLRRDPRVWFCALPDTFFGEWASVAGHVEIIELPQAMDLLVDYYRRASGEHPDWDDYRAAMERDRRVVVRVTVDDIGPKAEG